ncbi:MAG: alpha/beta hydrolase domain-containing protein, partial [Dehalococcoidia bacterium]
DGLLRLAIARGKAPKIMHVNTSCEYWGSQAALIHLTPSCDADTSLPENVRIYLLAGTQHISTGLPLAKVAPETGHGYYHLNTIDYRPLLRALITNLDDWATRGVEPPASSYPRLNDGTLVTRESVRSKLAGELPGPGVPEHCPPVLRLDFGPDAVQRHVAEVLPPKVVQELPGLVPAVDDDGNELVGIRHPDVAVPLATYTGWNPRHASIGGTTQLLRSNGATIPFARDIVEAEATSDLRRSIEARYEGKDSYLQQVRAAAEALVGERLLLADDVDGVVEYSSLRWDDFVHGSRGDAGEAVEA